ncbi:hypothetical protein V475_04175 [Sphingobium baderi LL03]|nr:hypothetical protein L485_05670 [Sphingobium baderi LL03]KMS63030.1 hypothetical protein V475_04175 [Sphingobium baderi LL03]
MFIELGRREKPDAILTPELSDEHQGLANWFADKQSTKCREGFRASFHGNAIFGKQPRPATFLQCLR